ncbi:hypothetical protein A4U88_2424 [Serratia marcescens]|nr:hypothetical protein A4U88_2424 [Serratia marcescens]
MEEIQREFALRHVKMLQDAEIKYAQREKNGVLPMRKGCSG